MGKLRLALERGSRRGGYSKPGERGGTAAGGARYGPVPAVPCRFRLVSPDQAQALPMLPKEHLFAAMTVVTTTGVIRISARILARAAHHES